MKIQCDVCNEHQASLFCIADEAALCDDCDHRVHHANKLASKHHRFSLTHPSAKHFPLCDICQEKRAFVFCQQDRAILCKECDVSIHSVNELTKNHSRFLLTGIKFSTSAIPYSSSSSSSSSSAAAAKKNPVLDTSHPPSNPPSTPSRPKPGGNLQTNQEPGFTGSSISEYLINTIPGMKFEDFLDSHSTFDCSKNGDEMLSVFGEGNMVSFSSGGIWVPQAPPSAAAYWEQMGEQNGYREGRKGSVRSSLGDDNNFEVPQMSPPSNVSKKSRFLW
ncbi:B-box zinc finger protein 21-like isoform X2 [Vigna umbellata]|uniref:B-box zinc finger protein 21-like isoform X1 n=1 Tax=Vigna umbellata TaxID=87088 RepID=UPI001F5FBFF0|nr:B-box zinc finger protein 21-like isoform X1 [Vigna umbellata]XP_047155803.1 B-box zinc finger protein 21-like isoform X2 [Vigna umbellata]